uniref:Integrase catalytic domain-containing protein n=1 Tax=Fagus sylvatica TaxID=28930 RepID=A0A2N9GBJ4_FAGSY
MLVQRPFLKMKEETGKNLMKTQDHTEKEATFVTMSDVANLLKQEREKNPKESRLFVRKPPYPAELLKQPCPEKYIAPTFSRFDSRKGSASCTHYTTSGSLHFGRNEWPFLTKWVADGIIKLPEAQKKATEEDKKNPKFCYFHRYVHHSYSRLLDSSEENFHEKIQDGTLELPQVQQKVHTDPFLKHKDRAVVSVVIHGSASDVDVDESATKLAQQLLRPIMAIAADSGAHCFTAETHASRAFLETTNAITFTDEDMEVQYPDHRRPLYFSATINEVQVRRALVDNGSCINLIPLSTIQVAKISQKKIQGAPMEIKGFGGVGEYTKGHIQLVLKVGPIVALTWLNGKPIRIAANSTPFDQSESHFVEAALYDEITPAGEASLAKPIGIPLPKWEEIKDALEADLRDLLERKKKRRAEASTSKSQPQYTSESANTAEATTVDPKISAKEELEVIDLSSDPNVHKPVSISASLSVEERMHLIELLKEYQDVFTWQYEEMLGIDSKLVAHSLNVEPGTKPVVQPMRTFHPEVETQITQEVKKLLSAGFIKPIQHPRWLSNIVPVKKKNGQIRCCVDFPAGHAMFSFMDGFSGYNQIFMSPRDTEKTAFRTPIGNFYYTVMPFGLKNARVTYQRTMTAMFHDMMHCEIEDYVDDIVVKSKTRGDHFARASAIATMKPPTTHKELKSFLGKLSYIRRFIPGLAAVTSTFAPLLKKGAPFRWSTECQQAFEKVQDIMTKLPTVCAPTSGKPLRLYLASNSQAIGALIAQEDGDAVEQPVYYVSCTLKDAESRYSGAERSCLALIYASPLPLTSWLISFLGKITSSISDEVPGEINEVFLAGLADSVWTLKFDGSLTTTSARAGIVLYKDDGEAVTKSFKFDFPCSNNAAKYEVYLAGLAIAYEMGIKHLRVIGDSNLVIKNFSRSRRLASTNQSQAHFSRCYGRFKRNQGLHLDIGDLYRRLSGGVLARCISIEEAKEKLPEVHEKTCGDGGAISLYRRLQHLIGPINPASGGYIWILVATEYFTKWVEAIPLRKATGAAVANFIREHIITRFGILYKLITDNGTPFINKDVREVLEHYRVKHRRSTPYYPQGNGQAEATNRMLLRILSKMVFNYGNDWKAHLADVLWAYRSSPKTATGFTPFSLVYGTVTVSPTELVVPSPRVMQGSELEVDANMCAEARMADLEGLDEARDLAKVRSQRNYQKMANVYSKAFRVQIFTEGQMVLKAAEFVRRNLSSPSKFSPNWDGPYIIREVHGSGYYRLSKSDGTILTDPINGKWLKHYYS